MIRVAAETFPVVPRIGSEGQSLTRAKIGNVFMPIKTTLTLIEDKLTDEGKALLKGLVGAARRLPARLASVRVAWGTSASSASRANPFAASAARLRSRPFCRSRFPADTSTTTVWAMFRTAQTMATRITRAVSTVTQPRSCRIRIRRALCWRVQASRCSPESQRTRISDHPPGGAP